MSSFASHKTTKEMGAISVRDFLGLKETAFALFLFAGIFKATPGLEDPFDLTVLTAVVSLGYCVYGFLRAGDRRLRVLLLLSGLFLVIAPTLIWTEWHDYAVEKVGRFYTLTLLAAIAPLYLIRTRQELRRFLCASALLSGVATIGAFITLLTAGKDVERLLVLSASTISLARAIGVVFLFLSVWCFRAGMNHRLLLALAIPLVILLVAVGERGPILATAFALVLTHLLFRPHPWRGLAQTFFLILAVVILLGLSEPWIPATSLVRVQTFFGGEPGESEIERIDFLHFSLQSIPAHPLGVGLGGFATLYGAQNSTDRVFPHNILVETFLESGWLAGFYLVFLFWRALRGSYERAIRETCHVEFQLLFCLLAFFLVNEQVSGELNDSRALFAFLALALAFATVGYETVKGRSPDLSASSLRSAHIP